MIIFPKIASVLCHYPAGAKFHVEKNALEFTLKLVEVYII